MQQTSLLLFALLSIAAGVLILLWLYARLTSFAFSHGEDVLYDCGDVGPKRYRIFLKEKGLRWVRSWENVPDNHGLCAVCRLTSLRGTVVRCGLCKQSIFKHDPVSLHDIDGLPSSVLGGDWQKIVHGRLVCCAGCIIRGGSVPACWAGTHLVPEKLNGLIKLVA